MSRCLSYIAIWVLATSCSPAARSGPEGAAGGSGPTASYDRLVRTARSFADSGRGAKAIELAEQAAKQEPERPEAYLVWGLGLAQQGQLEASAAKYEMARKHGSKDRRLFVELASVYDVAQKYHDAVRVYRGYLADHTDDAEMLQELGLTLLLLQRYDKAVLELAKVAQLKPNDLQAQQDYGYALLHAGKPGDAAPIFERVVAKDPKRHDALLLLARARAAEGEPAEAVRILDRLIAKRPTDERPLKMRARLFLLMGMLQRAAEDYGHLLGLARPDDAAVLLGYAGTLIALDDLAKAEKILERVRKSLEEHPLLDFRDAQIAWRRGKRRALKTLVTYGRDNPMDVEAWRDVLAAAKRFKDRKLKKEAITKLRALGDI